MVGFIAKIFICPTIVVLASFILPNVNYATIFQPIMIGLVLALAAHIMEVLILKKGTFWLSSFADFVAAVLIVYFGSLLFTSAYVTFWGALITALFLTLTELIQHRWLIRSGRTQKSPA